MTTRRKLLQLAALGGGAVYLSGLEGCAANWDGGGAAGKESYFVQMSDPHWGFVGDANPDSGNTLKRAVAAVNALSVQPDFVVFTGDLTHTTDDPVERRTRLAGFREIVSKLKVQTVHFMPGEHDAALDRGAAYKEFFGETFYSFDHMGVHFLVIDNVSEPGAIIGAAQLAWMKHDLAKLSMDAPIVVLTHRPLFDLAPKWDWATRDGSQALEILMQYSRVTVFYGHIHQEHHHMTGHIAHHSAKSLIFPLPKPGSQDKRTPLTWDPGSLNHGLGMRKVQPQFAMGNLNIQELGLDGTLL